MKILTIHADFIEFEAKKRAFKGAEEGIEEGKQKIEECLVVFTAVEKRDETNKEALLKRYVQEVKNIAVQVKAEKIVLYPYAHLSSSLSAPKFAEEVLKEAEQILKTDYQVSRAPFGWYKSFNISCKGHPLSELSREFTAEETSTLKREAKDEPFRFKDQELSQEEKITLSTAFIVAKAVKGLFPEAKLGSSDFYHDQAYIDIAGVKLRDDDKKRIEKKAKQLISEGSVFAKLEDKEMLGTLQQEVMKDLGEKAELYQLSGLCLAPLYKEPFVYSTKEIGALKVLNIASAYWKGNENNQQLTRVYCIGFASEEMLQEYEKKQEEAENRSHLKIGKEQGLFVVSNLIGAGLPLLAPKGAIINNKIVEFLWELHKHKGYSQVKIPHIAKESLYKKSGHWEKFGDELFTVKGKTESFVLKPMNCPHHIQIFDAFPHSYRDLPIRFFEPTTVYRDEKAGQLVGLSRVRSITQDDGHIFCRVDQIKEEVKTIVEIVIKFYHTLGMDKDYWVSLSVRGDDQSKYLGGTEVWDLAESSLEEIATTNNLPFKKIKGEAAFYGPKLDFMFKDALGREWQLATVQLDFNLPERFELSYMNQESKKERPVMIHRAISGSLERFMSVLIEHFAGKFPLWLSPVQVKIVTITDRSNEFAQEVMSKLRAKEIRVELDDRAESMGRKVRDAQLEKVNYIVTIGDKEMDEKVLAVRSRDNEQKFGVDVEEFIADLLDRIKGRELD